MVNRKLNVVVSEFLKHKSANVALAFSIGAIGLLGVGGVAVDYTMSSRQQAKMQAVADAASLAAVNTYVLSSLNKKKGKSTAENEAIASTNEYIFKHGLNLTAVPVITVSDNPASVTVSLNTISKRTISKVLGVVDGLVTASATAVTAKKTSAACVIGLETSATPAVNFKMSDTFQASDCAVWSNSIQATSLAGSGSGSASAAKFCAVGGVQVGSTSFSVPPEANCEPVKDPFASLNMPPVGLCTHTNFTASSTGTITLSPGVYCGGIKLTGQANIQLDPGNYIIKDGDFSIAGGSSVIGTGITFFLTGTTGGLKFGGASSINIKAPVSGDYAGIAIFSDRNSPVSSSLLRGSNSLDIEGVVYLPNQDLSYSGSTSSLLPAHYTMLIAKTISFEGSSAVSIRSDFSASDIPIPQALIENRLSTRLAR